jgi:vacuolar-type H+-ATPase subunit E/Vma4
VTTTPEALAPVADALLAAARADADRTVATARADAERIRLEALEGERTIRAAARGRGAADGTKQAVQSLRLARRQAREAELVAQRQAYDELRRRVLARLSELRGDPSYADLLRRLHRQARATLGPGTEIAEAPAGGVVARAGGRRLDLTLPALAEQALESLGSELGELWA